MTAATRRQRPGTTGARQPAATASGRGRSAQAEPKRAGARRPLSGPNRFTEADRARAVEIYAERGPQAAAAAVGAGIRSVLRWAKAAGVNTPEERAAATEQARLELERRTAEARAAIVPKLAGEVNVTLDVELEIVQLQLAILQHAREHQGAVDSVLMGRLSAAQAAAEVKLQRIVGARTRAIHDLQLLTGGDTEHVAGGAVTVVFAVPPPDDAADAAEFTIIDLTPEPIAELGA